MSLNLRYEIEDITWAVRVWYPDSDAPTLFQPDWPDGTPWASKEEAEKWAQDYIAYVEDPESKEIPSSPNLSTEG
jgi:hypothetical protein